MLLKEIRNAALVIAAFCVLVGAGCKPKEVVITRDDTIAKEDVAIEELQTKITDRQKELDTLEKERYEKSGKLAQDQKQKRDEAIKKYEEFLAKYPISPYTPDVLIALGELYLERSEDEHVAALEVFQKKLEDATAADEVIEDPEPQPHYERTISAYQQIALKYKDFPYADVAYYGLGYCLKAQGEEEDSAKTFYKLTQLYPESKFVAEAYFRIGEYFFDQYEFDKAVKYYALVPDTNPDFYDKALYKMGWAYYNQGDIGVSSTEYTKAIESFTKLLESSGGTSVLTSEAMEFTAISITEWSTDPNDETAVSKALGNYDSSFRGGNEKNYSPDVLHELGNVYLYKQDKLKAAATAYESVLQYYPDYGRAPEILDSLVECYLREEDYASAHKTRVRVVDNYGPGSPWYEGQEDLDVRHKALQRWENALYEVAVYNSIQAEKMATANKPEESRAAYDEAIRRYNQYLASFPTNEKAYHLNFYLAEAYYAIQDFGNAGDQYQKTAMGYADRERYKIAKWDEKFTQENSLFSAIVAYDEIFQRKLEAIKNQPPPPEETPAETPVAEGVQPLGPVTRPVDSLTIEEANLVRACNVFADKYPQSPEIATVLSKSGEVYFFIKDYDRSRDAYERIVKDYAAAPDPAKKGDHDKLYVNAAENIANSYFNEAEFYEKGGDYRAAEDKYASAKLWYARTEKEAKERQVMDRVDDMKKLAGLTGLKSAEMKGAGVEIAEIETPTIDEGVIVAAAPEDFVVLYPPIPPIEATAFAAKQAEAQEYENNAAENQGNDVGKVSMGKAADTYYKIRDWDNAARVYLQYTKSYPETEDVRMAYEKAAECYERKEEWAKAADVYMTIVDHPKFKGTPLARDSLFRAGLLYEQLKDYDKTRETFARYCKDFPEEAKPIIEATYRQARAEERLGRNDDAMENFKKVAAAYKYSVSQGWDVVGMEKYASESFFKITDVNFDDYAEIQFLMPEKVMQTNLKKKVELSQNLIAGYNEVVTLGVPKWQVPAHVRMADVYIAFRDALRNAEIPKELLPETWENMADDDPRKPVYEEAYYKYTEELENQAMPLEDKAIAEYTEARNVAEANGIDDAWSKKAYSQLLTIRPADVIEHEDIGNQGLKSDTTWIVSNSLAEGWSDVKFDDSVWANAATGTWREKDQLKVIEEVPGGVETIWAGPEDATTYFRKEISFTYNPGGYDAVIQAMGSYKLYVNGTLVGQSDAMAKEPWVKPDKYAVGELLTVGDNVIAVEVARPRDDSFGLRFALVPEGGFPSPVPEGGEVPFEETGTPGEGGETLPAPGEGMGGEVPSEETGTPGEGMGGEVPFEETGTPGETGETLPSPGEGMGGETPAEVTPTEVTPAEGGETPPAEAPAEGTEPLPVPGEESSGESGGDSSSSETVDFESTGTPEETGGTEAPVEEGGGDF